MQADQWPDALGHLLRIARGTTTYFQRSPNGPLTLWALLEVLQPYAPLLPLDVLRAEPDRAWRSEYYDFHSETTLLLGRIEQRAGAAVEASEALRAASRFLASYGMHKDVTVFGLIEALEPIHEDEHHAEVSRRLRALQLLCDRALAHSDGKETNHAPSAWYRAFALHTPGGGGCVAHAHDSRGPAVLELAETTRRSATSSGLRRDGSRRCCTTFSGDACPRRTSSGGSPPSLRSPRPRRHVPMRRSKSSLLPRTATPSTRPSVRPKRCGGSQPIAGGPIRNSIAFPRRATKGVFIDTRRWCRWAAAAAIQPGPILRRRRYAA